MLSRSVVFWLDRIFRVLGALGGYFENVMAAFPALAAVF